MDCPPIAKAISDQPSWKTLGKADLRTVREELIEASPQLVNGANSLDEAVHLLRVAIGMGDKPIITVQTPIEKVIITADSLPHVVEKRSDQRERFGLFVLPTLLRPSEVWKVQYDDGSFRNRYLKLFSGSRYDLLVMVKVAKDGSIFWNMMHRDRKGMNSLRIGDLVFDGL